MEGSTKKNMGGLKYAVALRAIGQDLAGLLIESLEITIEGKAFVVKGNCIAAAQPKSKSIEVLQKLGRRLGRMTSWSSSPDESSRGAFARRYTAEEIQVLDMLGSARQTGVLKTPDPSSGAETLRTVGRVVDARNGRLLKLSKDQRKITFAYHDEKGRLHKEDIYSLTLYQTQRAALSLRAKTPVA